MKDTILTAKTRTGNAKQVRDAGFIPGVLNDSQANSTSVQFEASPLNKVLIQHGSNARVWVKLGKEKTHGFIKHVQRHPVDRTVIHVSILLVAKGQEVKMQLPIVYHGRDELESRQLHVQAHKMDAEVSGTTEVLPDSITIDVSKCEEGYSFTAADFDLPKGVKVLDAEDEVYGVVRAARKIQLEETEEEETTEEEPAE